MNAAPNHHTHDRENLMGKTESDWRTIDFRPAPAGWRVAYLAAPEPS